MQLCISHTECRILGTTAHTFSDKSRSGNACRRCVFARLRGKGETGQLYVPTFTHPDWTGPDNSARCGVMERVGREYREEVRGRGRLLDRRENELLASYYGHKDKGVTKERSGLEKITSGVDKSWVMGREVSISHSMTQIGTGHSGKEYQL